VAEETAIYAGNRYAQHPDRAAFIMAGSGETVTYAEHERRTNQLAHLLRAQGLRRLDHFAIFMENNSRYLECDGAGERSGLYYTCINSYLTPDELAYIIDNSQSQLLITSIAKLQVARAALAQCPRVKQCLVVDGGDAVRALRARAMQTSSTPWRRNPARRLPTSGSARRCCIRRGPPGGPKAS
jgi:long-chain acyl-CoA synthetase